MVVGGQGTAEVEFESELRAVWTDVSPRPPTLSHVVSMAPPLAPLVTGLHLLSSATPPFQLIISLTYFLHIATVTLPV